MIAHWNDALQAYSRHESSLLWGTEQFLLPKGGAWAMSEAFAENEGLSNQKLMHTILPHPPGEGVYKTVVVHGLILPFIGLHWRWNIFDGSRYCTKSP